MMVSVTTRQPSPLSGVSVAAGPRLLIRQVQYLLSSQLTFIFEGSSPIRRLHGDAVGSLQLGPDGNRYSCK